MGVNIPDPIAVNAAIKKRKDDLKIAAFLANQFKQEFLKLCEKHDLTYEYECTSADAVIRLNKYPQFRFLIDDYDWDNEAQEYKR